MFIPFAGPLLTLRGGGARRQCPAGDDDCWVDWEQFGLNVALVAISVSQVTSVVLGALWLSSKTTYLERAEQPKIQVLPATFGRRGYVASVLGTF